MAKANAQWSKMRVQVNLSALWIRSCAWKVPAAVVCVLISCNISLVSCPLYSPPRHTFFLGVAMRTRKQSNENFTSNHESEKFTVSESFPRDNESSGCTSPLPVESVRMSVSASCVRVLESAVC
jgi:hypothetical protein